jgi:SAM-dependent methyltransferase
MHAEAWYYLMRIRGYIQDVSALRVLEFGAHDVNGTPRKLFEGCYYVGVDPWPGEGVDVVARAQDFDGDGKFDLVISAETLEHDQDPQGQIASAWRALKPGGKFILTAAAEPRAPHRCDGSLGDLNGEYYANIDPAILREWLGDWRLFEIQHDKQHGDVYALAVKP